MASFRLKKAYDGVVGGVRHTLKRGHELADETLASLIELDQPGTIEPAEPEPEPEAATETAPNTDLSAAAVTTTGTTTVAPPTPTTTTAKGAP